MLHHGAIGTEAYRCEYQYGMLCGVLCGVLYRAMYRTTYIEDYLYGYRESLIETNTPMKSSDITSQSTNLEKGVMNTVITAKIRHLFSEISWFQVLLAVIALPTITQAADIASPKVDSHQANVVSEPAVVFEHLSKVRPNVWVGGQPSPAELAKFAEAGGQHVINLRTTAELTWDESAQVASLGMQYHHLPVPGAKGITADNAEALHALLESLSGEPVVLHCASGNRVGALVALQHGIKEETKHELQQQDIEQAIAKGREWGLTRLDAVVRDRLAEQNASQ